MLVFRNLRGVPSQINYFTKRSQLPERRPLLGSSPDRRGGGKVSYKSVEQYYYGYSDHVSMDTCREHTVSL